MGAYPRKVPTGSGATAVQVVWSRKRGLRAEIEHIGSGRTAAQVSVLWAEALRRISAGQDELPLSAPVLGDGVLEITEMRMGRLLDALSQVYRQLGFDQVADQVFEQQVTARIIEATSKLDSLRVLAEAGMPAVSYATLRRHLSGYAEPEFRQALSGCLASRAALGPSALCLYDVTTLYFETDEGDGFRESGFSKERRLEPQITVGLLTDAAGLPLMVEGFEGNRAETKTMIPVVKGFVEAHGITSLTVVADAGMLSEANMKEVEDLGWTFIVGGKLPEVPWVLAEWLKKYPGVDPPDGLMLSQPTLMGVKTDLRKRTIHYHYSHDRARRSLKGITEQVAKAERAAASMSQAGVKRNRFLTLVGGSRSVNRALEAKATTLAGWKAYVTNLDAPATDIIGWYHQLWQVERSFRMSKHDLKARPIYHHQRESIDAHLAIVMAALAVSRTIEQATGWTISRFVKTFRTYRQATIDNGLQKHTAEHRIPPSHQTILDRIHNGD